MEFANNYFANTAPSDIMFSVGGAAPVQAQAFFRGTFAFETLNEEAEQKFANLDPKNAYMNADILYMQGIVSACAASNFEHASKQQAQSEADKPAMLLALRNAVQMASEELVDKNVRIVRSFVVELDVRDASGNLLMRHDASASMKDAAEVQGFMTARAFSMMMNTKTTKFEQLALTSWVKSKEDFDRFQKALDEGVVLNEPALEVVSPKAAEAVPDSQVKWTSPAAAAGPIAWKCSCGSEQTSKFCPNCGSPRPDWTCSCGHHNDYGKFCSECGKPRA